MGLVNFSLFCFTFLDNFILFIYLFVYIFTCSVSVYAIVLNYLVVFIRIFLLY